MKKPVSKRILEIAKRYKELEDGLIYNGCNDNFGEDHLKLEDEILQLYLDIRNVGFEWHNAMSNNDLDTKTKRYKQV